MVGGAGGLRRRCGRQPHDRGRRRRPGRCMAWRGAGDRGGRAGACHAAGVRVAGRAGPPGRRSSPRGSPHPGRGGVSAVARSRLLAGSRGPRPRPAGQQQRAARVRRLCLGGPGPAAHARAAAF
jgi:hypothetical protein